MAGFDKKALSGFSALASGCFQRILRFPGTTLLQRPPYCRLHFQRRVLQNPVLAESIQFGSIVPACTSEKDSELPEASFWTKPVEPCGLLNCPFEPQPWNPGMEKKEYCFVCCKNVPARAFPRCLACHKGVCILCIVEIHRRNPFRCCFCRTEYNRLTAKQIPLFYEAHLAVSDLDGTGVCHR